MGDVSSQSAPGALLSGDPRVACGDARSVYGARKRRPPEANPGGFTPARICQEGQLWSVDVPRAAKKARVRRLALHWSVSFTQWATDLPRHRRRLHNSQSPRPSMQSTRRCREAATKTARCTRRLTIRGCNQRRLCSGAWLRLLTVSHPVGTMGKNRARSIDGARQDRTRRRLHGGEHEKPRLPRRQASEEG